MQVKNHSNVALWLTLLLLGTMSGMARGDVTLVSADAAGVPGNRSSFGPSISADGRFVVFASFTINLVPEDSNDDRFDEDAVYLADVVWPVAAT